MKLTTLYLLGALFLPSIANAQMEQPITRALEAANPDLEEDELFRITHAILKFSDDYDLKPELVTAVILVESSAKVNARSRVGALGLMQIMPSMLKRLKIKERDIEHNIEAGCIILADNIRRMGLHNGILAYYWGPNIRGRNYLKKVQKAQAIILYHKVSIEEEIKNLKGEDL